MDENGEHSVTEVNRPTLSEDGETVGMENDLSVGKYDLIATVGASFASKRQEMTDRMERAMQYAGPEVAQIIAPLMFKFDDTPGSQEIAAAIEAEMKLMQERAQK